MRGHRAGQGGGGPGKDLRINLASRKRFQFNEEEGTERRGKLASSRGGGMRRLSSSAQATVSGRQRNQLPPSRQNWRNS